MRIDHYPSRSICETFMLARRDPVIWSEDPRPACLSETQAQQYANDGYVLFKQLLTEAEVRELRTHANQQRETFAASTDERVILEPSSGVVRSLFAPHLDNAFYQRIMRHPRILPIAEYLLGVKPISIRHDSTSKMVLMARPLTGIRILKPGIVKMECPACAPFLV